jgi:uncharacterized protein
MPEYLSPGVYYERVDASPPTIAALRTDVVGFVGISLRGPLDTAIPLTSWRQFQAYFGRPTEVGYLAYAVRAFFENGGQRCWVVRAASKDGPNGANSATFTLSSLMGQPVWSIDAFSPGTWGNQLTIVVRETHRAQANSIPAGSSPDYVQVDSITGFERGTLVSLHQEGRSPTIRVVSAVDGVNNRLYWVHPERELRLAYDVPVTELASDRLVRVESIEYSLLVFEAGRLLKTYDGLALVPEHPRYGPAVLAPVMIGREPSQRQQSMSTTQEKELEKWLYVSISSRMLPPPPEPIVIREKRDLPISGIVPLQLPLKEGQRLTQGRDGLAQLTPLDLIGEEVYPWDSDEVCQNKRRGLEVLARIEEVSILAMPDIQIQPEQPRRRAVIPVCIPDPCFPDSPPPAPMPPADPIERPPTFTEAQIYKMQMAMIQQCEKRRDRIALIDPPFSVAGKPELGIAAVQAWRTRFDSSFAALYYPWVKVIDPLFPGGGQTRAIPPSGHVAGQCASTDLRVGVFKAPANDLLSWAEDLTVLVNSAKQGILNPLGINAIRALPGRGVRIYGARTLSSDPDWKYLNVRRLLIMIEEAIGMATQWAVFEPNDALTRSKLRLSLTNFLLELWRGGALMGATAQEAFFVRCDESNNPAREREKGHLLAEVGVAPSYPFEFVVLRVGRTNSEIEITEA